MVEEKKKNVEMPGIEPGASHMRSERSTTELHPPPLYTRSHQKHFKSLRFTYSLVGTNDQHC